MTKIRQIVNFVTIVFGAAVLPLVVSSTYYRSILVVAFLYAVVAASWDLTLGYAGVFNFAQLATFGIGSYATAIFALRGIYPLLSLLLATILAVLFNTIVAIPVLRLRGVYVALLTFGAGQLVGSIALGWNEVTGGSSGLVLVPPLVILGFDFNWSAIGYIYLAETLLLITFFVLMKVVKAPFGLSLLASRDAESYALSRGIPVGRQRVMSLAIGGIFTGLSGGLFTLYISSAAPTVFGFGTATLVLSMVLVGGTGTIVGPILAAIFLTYIQNIRQIAGLGPITFMIISLVIILILRYLPGGLWDLRKKNMGRKSHNNSAD
jgi:branched-chain amino acid transport system permease protein